MKSIIKNKKARALYIVMVLIFTITFYLGIFRNPNFDIHDFCMGLSTEFIGLAIALVIVDRYISAKK